MTARTTTYPTQRSSGGLLILLLLAALAGILTLAALGVRLGSHAVEKHGVEALTIQECLDRKGPYMVYRSFEKDRFYLICELRNRIFGFQVVDKVGEEVTAFKRFEGTWKQTVEYLSRFGDRYKGPLPWLK